MLNCHIFHKHKPKKSGQEFYFLFPPIFGNELQILHMILYSFQAELGEYSFKCTGLQQIDRFPAVAAANPYLGHLFFFCFA